MVEQQMLSTQIKPLDGPQKRMHPHKLEVCGKNKKKEPIQLMISDQEFQLVVKTQTKYKIYCTNWVV